MALDTQIPLQAQTPQIDMASIYKDAMELRQAKQQFQTQNALKMIAARPDAIDPKTGTWTPNALRMITQADPTIGQKAAAEAGEAAERAAQTAHAQSETQTAELKRHAEVLSSGLSTYDAELAGGTTDPTIAERDFRSTLKDYVDAQPWSPEVKAQRWSTLSTMPVAQLRTLATKWSMTTEETKEAEKLTPFVMNGKTVLGDEQGRFFDPNTRQPIQVDGPVEKAPSALDPTRAGFEDKRINQGQEHLDIDAKREKLAEKVAAGGGGGLNDDDLSFAAEMVLNGQPMPNMGYGAAGAKARAEVLHKAAQMAVSQSGSAAGGADAAVIRKESLGADKAALTATAKQQASVRQFSETALGLVDKIDQTMAKGTTKAGPEWLAKVVQNIKTGQLGDPDTREFLGYITDLESENAKIMAGATGSVAQVSASNQELMSQILSGGMPASEIKGALKTIKSGIELRNKSLTDEIDRQKADLKGDTAGGQATPKGGGSHGIPQSIMEQYARVPDAKKAEAKKRLSAAGYDVSGL